MYHGILTFGLKRKERERGHKAQNQLYTPKVDRRIPDSFRQPLQFLGGGRELEKGDHCFHLSDKSLKVK